MTQRMKAAPSNPLARVALESPAWFGAALSSGGRTAGAAIALYIATNQSYDRTQVFSAGLAVLAAASLAPSASILARFAPALAAGALFFGGAALATQAAGVAMLVAGVMAACGALIANHRAGLPPTNAIGGFFFGLAVTVGSVVLIALMIEG
jgi:hypothetical protein